MVEQTGSFWRRLDWRIWRHAYITETPESERIAWVRPYDESPHASTTMGPDKMGWPAQVRDLSLGGIILQVKRSFDSGTLLRVELKSAAEQSTRTLLARVLHLTDYGNGTWLLGCCFAKELTPEELRPFGAEATRGGPSETRVWVRYECNVDIQFVVVSSSDHARRKARVVNISAGGVALRVAEACQVGALLQLELKPADGRPSQPVLARVVHVKSAPEGFQLGCTFVNELSDDDAQVLL
jgi:hypothetical protein